MFDLTIDSHKILKEWMDLLFEHAPKNIPIWIVGNKLDLLTDKLIQE